MTYRSPTRLTPATPDALAKYREDHVIEPVITAVGPNTRTTCGHDGLPLIRRGFYGYLHDPSEIRRLARIERGAAEYVA